MRGQPEETDRFESRCRDMPYSESLMSKPCCKHMGIISPNWFHAFLHLPSRDAKSHKAVLGREENDSGLNNTLMS